MTEPILAIALIPLFIGILLSQFLRFNVKSFQGVYLLLAAGATAVSYFYMNAGFLVPLIAVGVGFVVMLLLMGFFGTHIRNSDYALIEYGIGLFPWYLGFTAAIIYTIIFAGFAILIALRPKFNNPFKRRMSK